MAEWISSRKNEQVKTAAKLGQSASFRRQTGLFLAEGARLCADAFTSRVRIRQLFCTEHAAKKYESYLTPILRAVPSFFITEPVAELLSQTRAFSVSVNRGKSFPGRHFRCATAWHWKQCRIRAIWALLCARRRHWASAVYCLPVPAVTSIPPRRCVPAWAPYFAFLFFSAGNCLMHSMRCTDKVFSPAPPCRTAAQGRLRKWIFPTLALWPWGMRGTA